MHEWRTGGIRDRGTKMLIDNEISWTWWDEPNQLLRLGVSGPGSNPDGNTAYVYSIAFSLEELLRLVEALSDQLPKTRKGRRAIRKKAGALSKLLNHVLEHKD